MQSIYLYWVKRIFTGSFASHLRTKYHMNLAITFSIGIRALWAWLKLGTYSGRQKGTSLRGISVASNRGLGRRRKILKKWVVSVGILSCSYQIFYQIDQIKVTKVKSMPNTNSAKPLTFLGKDEVNFWGAASPPLPPNSAHIDYPLHT